MVWRRLPGHIEDFIAGPDLVFGLAMAFQAPLHIEGIFLPHKGHLINGAVATLAAYSLVYMNAVIEVDEIGQIVDPGPLQRDLIAKAGPHGFEHGGLGPDLRMAGHAGLRGGDASEGTCLNRGVAVATVDAHTRDVVFVAKRHRLVSRHIDLAYVIKAVDIENEAEKSPDDDEDNDDAGSGKSICTAREYLRHLYNNLLKGD